MAKCSENENFSSGTNSQRFIILPQREGTEPFLQPEVTFIFSIGSISLQSLTMCKKIILLSTSATNIATTKQ